MTLIPTVYWNAPSPPVVVTLYLQHQENNACLHLLGRQVEVWSSSSNNVCAFSHFKLTRIWRNYPVDELHWTALISQKKNSFYGQIMHIDRFAKQCFSFQGPINHRVLLRVINVAIMLFLITCKTITALTGSDFIIMFDYRQALCDARGLFAAFYQSWIPLGSTGDQERAMPAHTACSVAFLRALSLQHSI